MLKKKIGIAFSFMTLVTLASISEAQDIKYGSSPNTVSLNELAHDLQEAWNKSIILTNTQGKRSIRLSEDVKNIDHGDFLTLLRVNGLTAIEKKDGLVIINTKEARSSNLPVVDNKSTEEYPEDQYITAIIKLDKACTDQVLPAIRPLIPSNSHMSTYYASNSLTISDTYGNYKRIKTIISNIEKNINEKELCQKQAIRQRPKKKGK